jgi:hypothetical protein
MATTSKSTPPPADTKRTAETGGDATQRFTSAYADWTQQQQEISVNYQRQCSDAYFQLMNDLNEIAAKSKRPVEEAHLKLMLAGPTANVDVTSLRAEIPGLPTHARMFHVEQGRVTAA